MNGGRWLCHGCGHRSAEPAFSLVTVELPLTGMISDDDPSLPHGQVVKYKCPSCGSDKLAGAANSNPFAPKVVKKH